MRLHCDSPGMNCQDVCISEQTDQVIFRCLMDGFNGPLCPPHGALLSGDITPFPLLIHHHRWGREVVPFVKLSYHDFLNEPGIIMQCIICVHIFLLTPPTCIQLILLISYMILSTPLTSNKKNNPSMYFYQMKANFGIHNLVILW